MITAPIPAGVFLFGDDSVAELANRFTESDVLQEAHDGLAAVGDGVLGRSPQGARVHGR